MFYLLAPCLLTVLVEALFFALCGYRDRLDLSIVVYANIITNLSLNLILILCGATGLLSWVIPLECVVVIAEYLIYTRAFGATKRLFLITIAANALSFGIGQLLF